jgi:hypothetical protein
MFLGGEWFSVPIRSKQPGQPDRALSNGLQRKMSVADKSSYCNSTQPMFDTLPEK